MPEAISAPHTVSGCSIQEDDEINESVDNSLTRDEPLWRDRHRSISLSNAKECNEIVRQFLLIDFDESMILTETFDEMEAPHDQSVNMEPTVVN